MDLKRILLVEDDVEDQSLFLQALDTLKLNIQCRAVNNGKEALEHLDIISRYEMIFLDLNMPLMNGIDCLKALKQHSKYKDIPVIIFTTSMNPADIENCKTMGAKTIFRKPNKFPDLCSGLHSILIDLN